MIDLEILSYRRTCRENLTNSDLRICGFGSSVGKESLYAGQYCNEWIFNIKNIDLKEKILNILKNTKWEKIYKMTKSPVLQKWQIVKYLKEQIPELK